MHETKLFKNIPSYLAQEENVLKKDVTKLYVTISEFGSFSEEHVRHHLSEALKDTKWHSLAVTVVRIPYGPDFEITKIELQ